MNATTKTFLDNLADAHFDANNLTAQPRKEMLRSMLAHIDTRNLSAFGVDPAGVDLSDAQWDKVRVSVSLSLNASSEEY